jgi:hypothetical protein
MTQPDRGHGGLARWAVVLLLVGHGLIHLLGPIEIWGVADIAELDGQPSISLGSSATDIVAGVWLILTVLFVAAGVGVTVRRWWWRMLAVIGVIISQVVIVIWWDDAATGTIPNLLVLAAIVFADRLGLQFRHPEPHGQIPG